MPKFSFSYDISFALFIGAEILVVLAFLKILSQRRSPTGMIAWILAIFIAPYVSAPLFFILSDRKIFKRGRKSPYIIEPLQNSLEHNCKKEDRATADEHIGSIERLLAKSGIPPATKNNRFELFDDGVTAYEKIYEALKSAECCIDICIYQLKLDSATVPLLECLAKKASKGVRVRLLLDSIGSYGLYLRPWRLKGLREAGVEIAFFMPFLRMPFRNYINLRNHRKIMIFDNNLLYTGGVNLTSEYLAPDTSMVGFTDFLCRIEGDAIYYYHQLFLSDWCFATGESISHPPPIEEDVGNACIQVAPSGPDMQKDALYETYLAMINAALHEIVIITPYFSPNSTIMDALRIALHKGVRITLVAPIHSDHIFSDLARASFLHDLFDEGANVLLHTGKTLHAKAMIFDRSCAMVGSTNFDSRSLFYNYEINAIIYSEHEIEAISNAAERVMKNTIPYRPLRHPLLLMVENFMRTFAPLV
ncbi:phospholipase D-like domain-containing protein [Hydrogenimonas sp.]